MLKVVLLNDIDVVYGADHGDYDRLTLPDGSTHTGSDCPTGAALAPGDTLSWHSGGRYEGSVGNGENSGDNGCGAKGTCGLPYSHDGLGGGWVVCFV
eukprot:SAG22_NODE_6208_length_885_cov_1.832061_1_plen_97_part_00